MTNTTIETGLFTPRNAGSGVRLEMQIDEFGRKVFGSLGSSTRKWVTIYDHVTKKNYLVRRASCGLRCACDAVYKEI